MKVDFSPCEISDLYGIFCSLNLCHLPFLSDAQVSYFKDKFDILMSEVSD